MRKDSKTMGIKERFSWDKENYTFTRVMAILGFLLSLGSLAFSFYTFTRQNEIQANLATPTVNLSVQLSQDKKRYEKVQIISDGRIKESIEIIAYPYLRTFYSIPSENFPEDWILTYEHNYVDMDFTSVHQFLIPIIPSYEFYDLLQENAKDGVIDSIQDSEYSSIISDYITGASDFFMDNYGIHNVSFSLEYFLELKYKDLLDNEYCDIYRVVTGTYEGSKVNAKPYFEKIDTCFSDHSTSFSNELEANGEDTYFEIDPVESDFKNAYYLLRDEIESYEHHDIPWGAWEDTDRYHSTESSHRGSALLVFLRDEKEDIYSRLSDIIFEHQKNIAGQYSITIQTVH